MPQWLRYSETGEWCAYVKEQSPIGLEASSNSPIGHDDTINNRRLFLLGVSVRTLMMCPESGR